MSRNFSNTSKPEDLEWKKLRHFKGDRSSFYVRHDTFISPSSKVTIDKPAYKRDIKAQDEASDKLHESMRQLLDGEAPEKQQSSLRKRWNPNQSSREGIVKK
eukprot:TRINITY_DN2662_c0_g1_i2.p1 TRINITY_DN2662_c0_g1~~TRINITY_DN2662_c0_g1_i2.p1  ORF type:complete len:102 (-),score=19.96 TRINITY_DN2662_c0_g1_i2:138-443(-)